MRLFVFVPLATSIAQFTRHALVQRQTQPTPFVPVKPLALPAQQEYVLMLRFARDDAWTSATESCAQEGKTVPDRAQKRSERIQLMLDVDELEAIDAWRFDNRLPTRAAAIRELIRRGLMNRSMEPPETKDARTTDFGVVSPQSGRG
jgi:hypothetical protein